MIKELFVSLFILLFLIPLAQADGVQISYSQEILENLDLVVNEEFSFLVTLTNRTERPHRVLVNLSADNKKFSNVKDNFIIQPNGVEEVNLTIKPLKEGSFDEIIDINFERIETEGSFTAGSFGIKIKGYIRFEEENYWWVLILAIIGAIGAFLAWFLRKIRRE